jgi:Rieske Fe-S protein
MQPETHPDGDRPTAKVGRRSVLVAGAVAIPGAALAACSPAKAPAGDTSTAAAGAGSSGAGSGAGGATLAKLSGIKVGEAVSAKGADGKPIVIARPTETTVAAFSAICTHQGCKVAPAGRQLDCPCHGSVFDATTGAVVNGPAQRPLSAVKVTLSGDDVIAG